MIMGLNVIMVRATQSSRLDLVLGSHTDVFLPA